MAVVVVVYIVPKSKIESKAHYTPEPAQGYLEMLAKAFCIRVYSTYLQCILVWHAFLLIATHIFTSEIPFWISKQQQSGS